MTPNTRSTRLSRGLAITGCVLLLVMAGIHGSGFFYVTDLMRQSDAPAFIQDVFPVLFAHPSLHLAGLAIFGLLALRMPQEGYKVFFLAATLVAVDSILAFALGGIVPGFLLLTAAVLLFFAGRSS